MLHTAAPKRYPDPAKLTDRPFMPTVPLLPLLGNWNGVLGHC